MNILPTTNYKLQTNGGFTLMETVVSASVFIIILSLATGTFVHALKTQRAVTTLASDNSNVTQAMEQMAREVRTGYRFNGTTGASLNFTNYKDEFVSYKLLGDGSIGRCANLNDFFCLNASDDDYLSITSEDIEINYMRFIAGGIDDNDGEPPLITIAVSVESSKNVETKLQTTVSSRNIGS